MNQNPEQKTRNKIDQLLLASGWIVQHKSQFIVWPQRDARPMEFFLLKQPAFIVFGNFYN